MLAIGVCIIIGLTLSNGFYLPAGGVSDNNVRGVLKMNKFTGEMQVCHADAQIHSTEVWRKYDGRWINYCK